MSTPKTNEGDGVKLWKALQQAEIEDDADEIFSMSDAELDSYVRENGGDPAAIRASGAALARELFERRERNAWHAGAQAEQAAFRERAKAARSTERLPRSELLARLGARRSDPQMAAPIAALFRGKTLEASTDDELQALLDQIELLGKLGEE